MAPSRALRPGGLLVFRREFIRLRRRPFLLFLTTVMPLLLMGVLAGVFSAGLATKLPIAVLDLDHSDLSRSISRAVDATPDASIIVTVSDLSEGKQLILSGAVHGLLMLPENLQRDVLAGRRPEAVFFYNAQTMTTGNLVLRGVNAAVSTVAAGIRLSLCTTRGHPAEIARENLSPIPVQVNPLFNPALNYAHFLLAALVPAVLQVVMVTTMAYATGMDAETQHRFRILRRLGGGLWPAMLGKILPYTLIFLIVLGIADMVLFGYFELPLRGSRGILFASAFLFIFATQMIGVMLALFIRPMASAVSIGTLLIAPSFGFMGIGFPRLAMNDFAYGFGEIVPGTWYLMARIDQTVRGTPPDLSLRPILVLLLMAGILSLIAAFRLQQMRRRTMLAKKVAP
ncbi:ABC transporter permease [Rhizobium sp.]|uniref:ABC transporter permease n=1 Tax=Rhizobium sp. TaxID=391 RepID=UPI00289AED2C